MKIELMYDPVKPETTVCIEEQVVDASDIYGFLYPVRNCLLQTWLHPTGSWSGLGWQLKELCRGDKIELVFHGRIEDYADVESALKGMDELTLSFQKTDPLSNYEPMFSQMEEKIQAILDEDKERGEKKTIYDLFPDTVKAVQVVRTEAQEEWMHVICTEDDFYAADQSELSCCMVGDEYLDSYEKLEKLTGLTRSMRRSQDMIFCCIEDPEKRADFAHFAAQFNDLEMRFDTEDKCVPDLEQKYGVPFAIRCQFRKYQRMLAILKQCYEKRGAITAKRTELSKEPKLNIEQTRELERSKIILNWFDRKEPYLNDLEKLLQSENRQFLKVKE